MSSTLSPQTAPPATSRKPPWGPPQYLAVLGVPVFVLMMWTLIGWMADGPHQITRYRTGEGLDYVASKTAEGIVLVLSAVVLVKVVRDCRRERRFLTFDVMFLICGASLFWVNGSSNFLAPYLTYSSHLVNLNDPCGHIPAVVNPDCGRIPNPVILIGGIETFLIPGACMVFCAVAHRLRARFPGLSRARTAFLVAGLGSVAAVANEFIVIPAHIWTYPGSPISLELGGPGWMYPIFPEFIGYGLLIGFPAVMRYFRDDHGRTFVERGMDHYRPGLRKLITLGALYFVMQACMWIPATMFLWPMSLHQTGDGWRQVPATLNNGMCDSPLADPVTRYGPCPGTPGFRMPVAESLPGRSP